MSVAPPEEQAADSLLFIVIVLDDIPIWVSRSHQLPVFDTILSMHPNSGHRDFLTLDCTGLLIRYSVGAPVVARCMTQHRCQAAIVEESFCQCVNISLVPHKDHLS